jgi:hypothetical protein
MILRNLKNQPFNIPLGGGTVRLGPMATIEIGEVDAELPVVLNMVRMRNVALEQGGGASAPAKPKKKSSRKSSKKKAREPASEAPSAVEPKADDEGSAFSLEEKSPGDGPADQYDDGNSF